MIIIVFIIVLAFFSFLGISSVRKKTDNTQDYLLAGQNVKPWLVALSAVATNNSGYMFIGMIGYTYVTGLQSVWLMIGWIFGDFVGSFFVYGNLKKFSYKYNLLSFGSIIGNANGRNQRVVQFLAGLISFIFLSVYASAQFSAGGKALLAILSWEQYIGVIVGAVLVVAYCFAGGIRASIWTDAAQSIVMIFAMSILLGYAIADQNGFVSVYQKLTNVEIGYMSLFDKSKPIGAVLLFILGWFFAGFGVVGQPHIMVRYMTLDDHNKIGRVRKYYYTWFTFFYAMAIGVGLLSRIVLNPETSFDPELALPLMSLQLLPDFMVGIMLAGIFAATISTADSLIISCTASFTNDIFPSLKLDYLMNKLITITITILAVVIAIWGSSSVFEIVIYAWAVLGSVFGPIIVLRMLGKTLDQRTTLAMMITAATITISWNKLGWDSIVYEMMPGILSAFSVYFISKMFSNKRSIKQY